MRHKRLGIAVAGLALAVAAGAVTVRATAEGRVAVSRSDVVAFQAAGDVGGGVLQPGTTYPPSRPGFATLRRGGDWVSVSIHTSGLPAGAYTVWWVVFDTPDGCSAPCGEDDLFNPDAHVSVFYAAGGVVRGHAAAFSARYRNGDDLGAPGEQLILGDGSVDPSRAEIHNVLKYHGPPSDEPGVLHEQTTTLMGGCLDGANAVDLGDPFGVQCFDPQAVVHPAP